jgi:membrane dipeptidase
VYTWGGINDHGKAVIEEMNDLGMVINVAHASNDAIIQSVAASRHPVIYSHGGFYKIVDHPRCISDEAATAVAAKGGVIMGLNWLRVIRQVTEAK